MGTKQSKTETVPFAQLVDCEILEKNKKLENCESLKTQCVKLAHSVARIKPFGRIDNYKRF